MGFYFQMKKSAGILEIDKLMQSFFQISNYIISRLFSFDKKNTSHLQFF